MHLVSSNAGNVLGRSDAASHWEPGWVIPTEVILKLAGCDPHDGILNDRPDRAASICNAPDPATTTRPPPWSQRVKLALSESVTSLVALISTTSATRSRLCSECMSVCHLDSRFHDDPLNSADSVNRSLSASATNTAAPTHAAQNTGSVNQLKKATTRPAALRIAGVLTGRKGSWA